MKASYHRSLLIVVLATMPLALTVASWKSSSSISFSFKTWGIEYAFKKGSCDIL